MATLNWMCSSQWLLMHSCMYVFSITKVIEKLHSFNFNSYKIEYVNFLHYSFERPILFILYDFIKIISLNYVSFLQWKIFLEFDIWKLYAWFQRFKIWLCKFSALLIWKAKSLFFLRLLKLYIRIMWVLLWRYFRFWDLTIIYLTWLQIFSHLGFWLTIL